MKNKSYYIIFLQSNKSSHAYTKGQKDHSTSFVKTLNVNKFYIIENIPYVWNIWYMQKRIIQIFLSKIQFCVFEPKFEIYIQSISQIWAS